MQIIAFSFWKVVHLKVIVSSLCISVHHYHENLFERIIITRGQHGGVVVSTVASQQEGSRFDPHLGLFCVEFACSRRVCMGSLRVPQLPPTVQKNAR